MARVDVVIVTYNSAEFLAECAHALRSSAMIASVTIIDNASADCSAALARDLNWGAPKTVLRAHKNLGFGAAANLGARAISCPSRYLMLLNPDARVCAEGLDRLVADLEASSELACVGADLRRSDGEPVSSARMFPTVRSLAARRVTEIATDGSLVIADWVCGALMLWRRTAFDQVGGFSSRYFLYFEDTDICRQACAHGWVVAIDGGVHAVHDQGHGRPTSKALGRVSRRSRRRYARRWLGVAGVGACAVADALDLVASGLRAAGVRR